MKLNVLVGLMVLVGLSAYICAAGSRAKAKTDRHPEIAGLEPIFYERWSPRAMSGQMISDQELMRLFEAARWAPSSYNEQPWRFIYAKKGTAAWDVFMNILGEFNRGWCANGAVLCVMISKKNFTYNGSPNGCHSFDTGAAWENLALQGHLRGLVVHGMSGFDYEKARVMLNVPDEYEIEAMCVIGMPADKNVLSKDLQAMETPSGRKPLHEIICEGTFGF